MVFMLSDVPSFGRQISAGLGSGLGQGLSQGAQLAAKMSMEKQKQSQKQQLIQQLMGSPASEEGFQVTPEKILAATSIDPALGRNLAELYKTQEKTRATEREESRVKGTAQSAFNRMAEILKEGKLGITAGLRSKSPIGFEKTAESVGEFQSLSGALEAMLVDMVSRGTLSNTRFKYITETLLPKPTDREPAIKGKLKALSTELGLDASALGIEPSRKRASSMSVKMKTPDGKLVTVPKDRVKEAMAAGGEVIK